MIDWDLGCTTILDDPAPPPFTEPPHTVYTALPHCSLCTPPCPLAPLLPVYMSTFSGGAGRDAAWLHAPANNFRGSMGHQFRSGLHKGDSIPLFVPQIYRTLDLQNYNGETNTIHVGEQRDLFGKHMLAAVCWGKPSWESKSKCTLN